MNEALKPETTKGSPPATPEAPPPQRRNLFGRVALVVALAAAAVMVSQKVENILPHKTESSGRFGPPPQTVRVASVTLGDMPLTIDALGTVTPFETVTIRTQIAGNLQEVGFKEGQFVKTGDFLAQIDPRPYQAALAQAQGQLAKDQSLLAQAQVNLARYEELIKQDSIAKQQVADQEALVAQDKAAIVTDQAQVQTAKLNLDYTRIVSPITGRVGLRLVDPGNYLQPSDATGIVVITEIDPISVVFTTPEDNLPQIAARLKSGAELKVTVLDRANVNQLMSGTLTTYDSQIDVTTGTIKMRATFANPNGVLFPNQFVNVRLLVDTMTGVALAPNASIQIGPSGNFVYVLNPNSTVSMRDVVVGPTDGHRTAISSGLKAGEKVVIDGVDRLRDGAKVTLSEAAPGDGAQEPEGQSQGRRRPRSESGAPGAAAGRDAAGHRHLRQQEDESGVGSPAATVATPGGQTAPAGQKAPVAPQ